MNRDPFYRQILDRLSEVEDGNLFEACVADLLRPEWPTLVPVSGGGDAGVDGAWVDEKGPGLLAVTTGQDVIRNVTKSLKSHLASNGMRRRVLVVTTQDLSARRCRNIEKRVTELGFHLAHHPYTQRAIAARLYHNSRWCRDLLGISGRCSSLSRIPKGIRPLRDLPLLHRADDYKWLAATVGDRVIVGQPGIGKTYLAQEYVNAGKGLFVTDDNLERVMDAIRDQQPTTLVVEDGHLRTSLLDDLRRFRAESGLDFDIVADCWPADAAHVCQSLSVGASKRRTLEPFSPQHIVELIKSAGIAGPNELMHQIVRQSVGCPGRAAMLVHMCLSNDVQDVWDGNALARWVHTTFAKLVSERSIQILAGFAIGGNAGTSVAGVAKILGFPTGEVCDCMAKLAAGGVVQEVGQDLLCVLPEPLRCVLVKEYFFDRCPQLPLDAFLQSARSLDCAVKTLIGAYGRGARVPSSMLVDLLKRIPSSSAWEDFVSVDPAHADLVLNEFPEKIRSLTRPLLHHTPERVIPALLTDAIDDDRPLHSATDHPLRMIGDWVESAPQGTHESVRRRHALWNCVKEWLAAGRGESVGLRAIKSVLSPDYDDHEWVPGERMTIRIKRGVARLDELRQIASIWPEVFEVLKSVRPNDWTPVIEAIDQWVYCGRGPFKPSDDYVSVFRSTAREMLSDLSSICPDRAGVQKQLCERAAVVELALELAIDPSFMVLYPDDAIDEDRGDRDRRHVADIRGLAIEWLSVGPALASARLVSCVSEAKASGRHYPDYSGYLCVVIAEATQDVMAWLDALMTARVDSEHLWPFADRAAKQRVDGWLDRITECLRTEQWCDVGVRVLLTSGDIDEHLCKEAVEIARKRPKVVEHLCLTNQIVEDRLIRLLGTEDPKLGEAVAVGLWHREPKGSIGDSLRPLWRKAVIAHVRQEVPSSRNDERGSRACVRVGDGSGHD